MTTTAEKDDGDDAMAILHAEARAVAQCFGVKEFDAVAAALIDRIVVRLGGSHIYVPKRSSVGRRQLYAQIRSKFDGINQKQLAREFGVSPRHIRRIIKSQALA